MPFILGCFVSILRLGSGHVSSGMGRFDGIYLKHSEIGPSQVMCVLAGPDQTEFILFVGHPGPKEL